jgi:peptidoglycan/LPS O-acetylase OafA/YrhL
MSFFGISIRNETFPIQRGGWLDAMRFIVASLIIVHHYQLAAPIALVRLHPVFARGYLLTDFFLIDSGYVLGRVYGERVRSGAMSWAAFFRKRVCRVCPAHLLMAGALFLFVMACAAVGVAPRHPEWFDLKQFPAQFFLVQAYGVPGGAGWNAPSWSISALLGCYLSFPLLIRAIGRAGPGVAIAAGLGVFALADILTWKLLGYPVYELPLRYGFFRALPLFFAGMALARFSQRVWIPARAAAVLGLGALAVLAALQVFGPFSLISLFLIALMIIAAGAIPVVRRSRLVEKAAVISFSMYITNEVFRIGYFGVVNAVERRIALPAAGQWALWAAGLLGALAFAVAFHFLIDMPTQRWLQPRFGARRSPSRVPRAAPAGAEPVTS